MSIRELTFGDHSMNNNAILVLSALLGLFRCAAADTREFSYLEVDEHAVATTNETALVIRGPDRFRVTGPHDFIKTVGDLTFEVSLASFVAPDVVVSVPAERLITEDERLDYSRLPKAAWPDETFRTLTSTCTTMTREQAEQLPEQTGVQWVLDAGFDPEGSFAVESTIKASADGRDEVSVEIIARVLDCEDSSEVEAEITRVRSLFEVDTDRKRRAP